MTVWVAMPKFTTLIDVESLRAMLGSPELRVVDCRHELASPGAGQEAWLESHIPGAVHAHLDHDLSGKPGAGAGRHPLPEADDVDEFFSQLGITPASQVVAYDESHGAFASRLWWLLRWRGHERVAVPDGGLSAWRESGYPLEQTEPDYPRADFRPGPALEQIADLSEIEAIAAGDSRETLLIDARAEDRFTGKHEPVDAVAGHIPNAINRPFMGNVTPDHHFLLPENLKERFPPGNTIHMCGSGVTACHNILGMRHAGRDDGKLYAGSWSGWIQDPDHPVSHSVSHPTSHGD